MLSNSPHPAKVDIQHIGMQTQQRNSRIKYVVDVWVYSQNDIVDFYSSFKVPLILQKVLYACSATYNYVLHNTNSYGVVSKHNLHIEHGELRTDISQPTDYTVSFSDIKFETAPMVSCSIL